MKRIKTFKLFEKKISNQEFENLKSTLKTSFEQKDIATIDLLQTMTSGFDDTSINVIIDSIYKEYKLSLNYVNYKRRYNNDPQKEVVKLFDKIKDSLVSTTKEISKEDVLKVAESIKKDLTPDEINYILLSYEDYKADFGDDLWYTIIEEIIYNLIKESLDKILELINSDSKENISLGILIAKGQGIDILPYLHKKQKDLIDNATNLNNNFKIVVDISKDSKNYDILKSYFDDPSFLLLAKSELGQNKIKDITFESFIDDLADNKLMPRPGYWLPIFDQYKRTVKFNDRFSVCMADNVDSIPGYIAIDFKLNKTFSITYADNLLDKPYEVLMVLSCFYPEMEFVEFVEKVNEFSIFKYDNYYLFLQKTDGFKGIKLYYYYKRRIKSKSRLNQIATKSGGAIFSENEASYNIDRNARRFIEKYMDKIY